MSNTELIRELRALTSAGMKDCKDALEETAWDLQKAIDVIKVKGLNIADGRTGRVASEGRVAAVWSEMVAAFDNQGNSTPCFQRFAVMAEVNCQTDFVANGDDFSKFANDTANAVLGAAIGGATFEPSQVEDLRKELVSKTKENVVVRRWDTQVTSDPTVQFFVYRHSNDKIGVLLTMKAPSEQAAKDSAFEDLGADLAMQVCAMSPLAVSPESISQDDKDRQRTIFETQLKEENKPEKMWEKIIEGKFRKWNAEVCLLEQESVVVPKTPVKQVVKNVGTRLGGEIQVLGFTRFQVGEGIEKKKDNLVEEVAKMM